MTSEFMIRVYYAGRWYRYPVKLAEVNDRNEVYHVITKQRTLVFTNNRPFFRNKGLKYRRPTWTSSEQLPTQSFHNEIIKELEKNIGL